MGRDGDTSITITDEQADELSTYGDTRKEQMASVLDLARGTADSGGTEMESELNNRLARIEEEIGRIPDHVVSDLRDF